MGASTLVYIPSFAPSFHGSRMDPAGAARSIPRARDDDTQLWSAPRGPRERQEARGGQGREARV